MRLNYGLKKVANVLTLIRVAGAVFISIVGLLNGTSSVVGVGWLLLALWLTDLFDGRAARKSGFAGEGFFADFDGWADLLLALSSFTLLSTAGYVILPVYVGVVAAVLVLVHLDFLVFQGVSTFFLSLFYAATAVSQDRSFLLGIAAFLGAHALFSQDRFVVLWGRFWSHINKQYL